MLLIERVRENTRKLQEKEEVKRLVKSIKFNEFKIKLLEMVKEEIENDSLNQPSNSTTIYLNGNRYYDMFLHTEDKYDNFEPVSLYIMDKLVKEGFEVVIDNNFTEIKVSW